MKSVIFYNVIYMYDLKSWNVLNIADKISYTVEELRTSVLNGCLQKSKYCKNVSKFARTN